MDQETAGGRVNQKARTRVAILESAVRLIRQGRRPTIEEAAVAVGVSKRTAYRYFISQDHLLADAALEGLRDGIAEMFESLSQGADAHARIAALARALASLSEAHEPELRLMMRAALERGGQPLQAGEPARGRRRLEWIETALQPVRAELSAPSYARLVSAMAVCLGVDALLVLRDVCGADSTAAGDLMAWMAETILNRTLAEER